MALKNPSVATRKRWASLTRPEIHSVKSISLFFGCRADIRGNQYYFSVSTSSLRKITGLSGSCAYQLNVESAKLAREVADECSGKTQKTPFLCRSQLALPPSHGFQWTQAFSGRLPLTSEWKPIQAGWKNLDGGADIPVGWKRSFWIR